MKAISQLQMFFPKLQFGILLVHLFLPTVKGKSSYAEHYGPTFITEPPYRVDFSNNSEAHIDCVAKGFPTPSVQWLRDDGSLVTDVEGHRKILKNGTIIFLPFRGDDYRPRIHAAAYKCLASNSVGSIISRTVHVRAVVNQIYDIQIYDEYVILGNTAVFKCHIPSFVKEYVKVTSWFKQEIGTPLKPISSGGRYVQTPSGELHILNVEAKDSQVTYRCQTIHRLTGATKMSALGKLTVNADIHSSVPPRISHTLPVIHAIEGDVIQFPCEAQGFPVPTHRWYRIIDRVPQPIASNERVREMFSFLTIEQVQLSDEGTFRCVVTNSVGDAKADTDFKVRAKLRAQVIPEVQTVDVGKPATFTCNPTGHPVTSVRWFKDGLPLVIGANRRLMSERILRIENVDKEDKGMYQCFVNNKDDEAQGNSELRLGDVVPTLDFGFEEMTVQPMSTISLKCVSGGQPTPRFHWTVDDNIVPTRDTRYRLGEFVGEHGKVVSYVNVSAIQVGDGGEYRCVSSNKAGSAEHSARIHVVGRPLIRPMPNMSVVAGTTAYVICRVLGYPIKSINWEMDNVLLPTNRRQTILDNGTLIIQDVSKALDEGVYKCIARSPSGELASRTSSISVLVPPLIDPFTFPRLLYEGMRARISCVVTKGDLPIAFSWLKDGFAIPNDLDVTQIQPDDHFSSTITFPSITLRHSGNYSCIAKNAATTVNHTAALIVNVPPRWLIQPNDTSAAFHAIVAFDCKAEGSPTPKITWKKAYGRGPVDYRDVILSSHTRILQNDSLLLDRVTELDEGYYLCEANNGFGTGLSKVIYLTVHAAAYFDVKSINQTSRFGHPARLMCSVKGDLPIIIVWKSNGKVIITDENSRIKKIERRLTNGFESELIISKIQREDSKAYKCMASNKYGNDETTIYLVVQEPPDAPSKLKILDHNSRTVQLEWVAPYDGNSHIQGYIIQYSPTSEDWRIPAQNVTVEAVTTRAFVHGLIPGTSYNFRVIARNSVGFGPASSSARIITSEEAPGGPPTAVTVVAMGPQTLKATWKPPRKDQRNGEIVGYYVGYKMHESPDSFTYETVSASRGTTEEITLKNLKKFTRYSITVKAFNGVGTGPSSDETIAVTSEDVPSEPPQNVQCMNSGTQSLRVTWDPPPPNSQNGILKGYKIHYIQVSPTDNRLKQERTYVIISAKSQDTSLTGLEKFTNYSIEVAALTQVGDGVKSEPRFCRTREDVPGPPNAIKAMISSNTSVLIVWRAPRRPNGVITKYNVYWSAKHEPEKKAVKLSVSYEDLLHDVTGLIENKLYDFWVTASTSVGEGESTTVVSKAPHHKVPASIASFPEITISPWRSDAVLPCLAVGSPVFSRIWKTRDMRIVSDDHYSITPTGSLIIHSVKRQDCGNYSCRVENSFGNDQIVHELIISAPPLPPKKLQSQKATSTSIVLSWESSEDNSNPILGYKLRYKRDFGGWEEVSVDASQDYVVLKNLHCGTRYQMSLQAVNSIGHGDPSETITVATMGSAPRIPSQAGVLKVNTTSVTLRLVGWPDGGCPIRHFVVQYRLKNEKDFILVSNNVIPDDDFIPISDLHPGQAYVIHITAHNDAGSIMGEYEFTTSMHNGDNFVADDAKLTGTSLGFETSIIVAAAVPAFLGIVLTVVCLVIRRKKYHRYQQSVVNTTRHEFQAPQESDSPEKRQLQRVSINNSLDSEVCSPSRRSNHSSIIHDDVCPYATFNLNRGRRLGDDSNQHLHLRTFAENEEALNQQSLRYIHDNNRKSQHLLKDQYSCLMVSPSQTTKLKGLARYPHHFASIDEIHKLTYLEAAHEGPEPERFSSVLYDGLLGDHSSSRYPKLTYLTESAVQLFEQTKVPDLLYHEKEQGDVHEWTDNDSDRYESSEVNLYSKKLQGLKTAKQRYESPASYQHYGVVR